MIYQVILFNIVFIFQQIWKRKIILYLEIVDVREVEGRKSVNMERIGFERGMDILMVIDMEIKEVVIDGYVEIGVFFSKCYVVNFKCVCGFFGYIFIFVRKMLF